MRRALNVRTLTAALCCCSLWFASGCDDPLQDQASIQPHERPLLSVPDRVVPVHPREPAASIMEAKNLENPVRVTKASLLAGKIAYGRYCSHCHGDFGRGWTSVGSSLDPTPPDLIEAIQGKTDGELFGTVTFGGVFSPALGPTVSVEDRWRIINYLRRLHRAREGVPQNWGQ